MDPLGSRPPTNYGSTSGYDPEIVFSGGNRELNALCDNVSTNVYSINSGTRNLKGALPSLGTNRDTQGLRDQIHVWQLSTNEITKATTNDIAKLNGLARAANKVQRLQAEKIINHFKEALESYSNIQQAVAEKLRNSLPRQQSVTEEEEASLLEDETRQQLQTQRELEFETGMLMDREQRIQNIESDILDANQIMRELAAMIHEQGAVVDSIESNIESTRGNVESGAAELQSANRYLNKTRRRNFILLAIAVIVLSVLIGLIIWSSK